MKLLFPIAMFFLFGFSACNNQSWKINVSSPSNGSTVTTSTIDVKGFLYISSSFKNDEKILKGLSTRQKNELASKLPPLIGNIYCNSKKAEIDRTKRTWIVKALNLTHIGQNQIFCYYQDSAGNTSQQTIYVNYKPQTNIAPVASFIANPTSGNAPLNVQLDASSSYDSDGTIASYSWTFSDQTVASGKIVSHTFTITGTHFTTLTVKDNFGKSTSSVQTIMVFGGGNTDEDGHEHFSPGKLALVEDPNDQFYPLIHNFTFNVSGTTLSTELSNLKLILNGFEIDNSIAELTSSQIVLNGLTLIDGKNELQVSALDNDNLPIHKTFILWAGDQSKQLTFVDENNNSVSGSEITIKLLEDQEVIKKVTNVSASFDFNNLPTARFVVSVKKGNLLGVKTIDSDALSETITLYGFKTVSTISNDDFSIGVDGWDISEASPEIVHHEEKSPIKNQGKKLDQDLRLSLESSNFQKVTRTIVVENADADAYQFRYKFNQGAEDTYQVVLRNSSKDLTAIDVKQPNSTSTWKTLSIKANSGDIVQIEVSLKAESTFKRSKTASYIDLDKLFATTMACVHSPSFTNRQGNFIPFLSVGPRVQFGLTYNNEDGTFPYGPNNTRIFGSIAFQGKGLTEIKDIKLVASQPFLFGEKQAIANLSNDATIALLNKPFSAQPNSTIFAANMELFEFPANSLDSFDGLYPIYLKVVATPNFGAISECSYDPEMFPLIQYEYSGDVSTYRMNKNRDPALGGDDWVVSYVKPYLDSLITNFSPSHDLQYNDISLMNGGLTAEHSSHQFGNDIDLRLNTYCSGSGPCVFNETKENAVSFVKFLNDYDYLNRIQTGGVFVEFRSGLAFDKEIQMSCLKDHRPAVDVILPIPPHRDHFHIRFQESPNITAEPDIQIAFPISITRTQTVKVVGQDVGGELKVDWGDSSPVETTSECTIDHTYTSDGEKEIRVIYTKNNACYGETRKVIIEKSDPLEACFTATPGTNGLASLDPSCSKGKIHKFKWTLPTQAGGQERGCGGPFPIHLTLPNGTHTVTLMLWGVDGTTKTVSKTFSTSNGDKFKFIDQFSSDEKIGNTTLACGPSASLPVALFTAVRSGFSAVLLNGSSSTSPSEILTYEWTSPGSTSPFHSTCWPDSSVGYLSGGTYTIGLKVLNADGVKSKMTETSIFVPGGTGDKK